MQTTLPETPIIRTTVLKRLETLVQLMGRTAGMAMIKGPAGIGKSFAISHIAETIKDVEVFTLTARAEIGGNVRWIANELLHPYGSEQHQAAESMQAVWNLVARRPFSDYPTRSVVIVDEAQTLKPTPLNAFKDAYDLGDKARHFGGNAPAFGLIFVGNATFLNRAGGVRKAAYEPLTQRFDLIEEFGRPSRKDFEAYVDGLPGLDKTLKSELVEFGLSKGSIRAVAKAWRAATSISGGAAPRPEVLDTIKRMMGGA